MKSLNTTELSKLKNILIVCDINWDNYALINKKLKKIDSENFRIHIINTKNHILNHCCQSNDLHTIRHSGKNIVDIFQNLVTYVDFCIIFTNSTEYLTNTDLLRKICDSSENNLPYVLVSEHSREVDYYSFDNQCKTFKKTINSLNSFNFNKTHINISTILSTEEIQLYNSNYYPKIHKELYLSESVLNRIRSKYSEINQTKQNNSIKLLYDKRQLKIEKQQRRCNKEYKQLEFGNNRLNYYKTSPTRDNGI